MRKMYVFLLYVVSIEYSIQGKKKVLDVIEIKGREREKIIMEVIVPIDIVMWHRDKRL